MKIELEQAFMLVKNWCMVEIETIIKRDTNWKIISNAFRSFISMLCQSVKSLGKTCLHIDLKLYLYPTDVHTRRILFINIDVCVFTNWG